MVAKVIEWYEHDGFSNWVGVLMMPYLVIVIILAKTI